MKNWGMDFRFDVVECYICSTNQLMNELMNQIKSIKQKQAGK